MIMSFLQTEDGKKIVQHALDAESQKKQKKKEEKKSREERSGSSQGRSGGNKGEIVPAAAEIKHLTVDIQFYKARSEKLAHENETLRHKAFSMEGTIRRLESSLE